MEIPTIKVTLRDGGHECVINEADYDQALHLREGETVHVEAEPEPAVPEATEPAVEPEPVEPERVETTLSRRGRTARK